MCVCRVFKSINHKQESVERSNNLVLPSFEPTCVKILNYALNARFVHWKPCHFDRIVRFIKKLYTSNSIDYDFCLSSSGMNQNFVIHIILFFFGIFLNIFSVDSYKQQFRDKSQKIQSISWINYTKNVVNCNWKLFILFLLAFFLSL